MVLSCLFLKSKHFMLDKLHLSYLFHHPAMIAFTESIHQLSSSAESSLALSPFVPREPVLPARQSHSWFFDDNKWTGRMTPIKMSFLLLLYFKIIIRFKMRNCHFGPPPHFYIYELNYNTKSNNANLACYFFSWPGNTKHNKINLRS